MSWVLLSGILAAATFFAGCSGGDNGAVDSPADANTLGNGAELTLRFGVYTSDEASTMFKTFKPLLETLEQGLQKRLGQSVAIEMKIADYAKANDWLVEGNVDFVRFGPASFVIAQERNADLQLIAMEGKGGEKRFKGVIFVRADSPIKELADLKGKSFAFGDENSTVGRYLAQAELLEAGVSATGLASYRYLGSHDKVAEAVKLGDFDAGSVKESTFRAYNTGSELRMIKNFDNVTKPWIARKGLEKRITEALRETLLDCTDAAALKLAKIDGFLPADNADFDFVRAGMQRAKAFGQ